MNNRIQTGLVLVGITLGLAPAPAVAQTGSKMNTADKDRMTALDKMSKEEKAAMFDKMSNADKAMATKMAGHDMSNEPTGRHGGDRQNVRGRQGPDVRKDIAMGKHMDKMDKAALDKAAMEKDKMDKLDKMNQ